MSLATKYDPSQIEEKWYSYWMKNGYFHAEPDPKKEPYTIVIPPPNVTGVLHMGHMLNNTIQDVLIRKARMEGKSALWLPGTDHASIATEAKVVKMLREQGIKKSDLSRDEFMEHAWEWKEKYGGIILEQLKKLGASCDWDRTTFTMDEKYHDSVITVFIDLYKKGYIYRGLRMINWDCEAQTALSNEEVIYNENGETATLYFVKYQIAGSDDFLTIATVRPETIPGDSAIAVNPTDERFGYLMGKKVMVPLVEREIPVIADDYVEMDFGTGCLKVTPAHDPNDYEIGQRHNLETIDTINLDGTLNEKCGLPEFVGMDRFEARKKIVKELKAQGLIVKEENFTTKIGRSERTNSVVEPKLSLQWFIKMKEISKEAHRAVMDDEVKLHPAKFKNTYNHWMKNVRDWCISRQLWWGQRIPAYYFGEGEEDFVVAASIEEAVELAKEKSGNTGLSAADLKQDEDVLDTWASSWLWPISGFDGFDNFDPETGKIDKAGNAELSYFYPTATLVTAPEILFFWVARMIIAGYEYLDEKPFNDVYLTGIVRDKQRRKMSKSLGNSPDPLELMKAYGADGIRTGMLFSSPAGNDLLFDEKLCEQGRNFSNKIWNAYRLVEGWESHGDTNETDAMAIAWMETRYNQALTELEDHFSKFRMSDALMTVYKLVWNDFCSSYLEWVKPEYGKPINAATKTKTIELFENLLKVLHPFMPFITEELWQAFADRSENEALIVSQWPKADKWDADIIKKADILFEVATNIRNTRNAKQISQKEELELIVISKDEETIESLIPSLKKMANLSSVTLVSDKPTNCASFVLANHEFFIPIGDNIDAEAEKARIEEELKYNKGFLISVEKKLSNERFVSGAPEQVVAMEKKKKADAEAKIKALEEQLTAL